MDQCNDSNTMAYKALKSLELHYTMIQFLLIQHRSIVIFASVGESDAIEHMVLKCEDILLRLPFLRLISRLVLEY